MPPAQSQTTWSRPQLEDAPTQAQTSAASAADSRVFLAVDHRDHWSPAWKGLPDSGAHTSSTYDFFMA
jgi:hypothetical protein